MNKTRISLVNGLLLGVVFLLFSVQVANAAPIVDVPVKVTQPDGTVLDLLASGDEYYNWLHDSNGYTIIQNPNTGYYVYADLVNGNLVPTNNIVGRVNPATTGLKPHLNISADKVLDLRQSAIITTRQSVGDISAAPHTGTITNLVVFIRFSGESEFTTSTSTYTDMLNSTTAGANSLRNYYQEVSYSNLTITSSLYPTPPGSTVVSYQDSHARGYYQPYNLITNPIGYEGGDNGTERTTREHTLLRDAINHVVGLAQFPAGTTIDADNDGIVDSVTFIVSGSPNGWASLLWPHKWNLYTHTVTIDGKTIDEYAFQLASTVGNGVLAHEMFHVLGAPDLYHYSGDGLAPVGPWDVMEQNSNPPQHMGCYMKFAYADWISSIPEITSSGTYTLNPLTSSTNNCYKIASPNSTTEYFVVEYRQNVGTFESSLPGSGLLVYRINTLQYGNSDGPPDEVYIYRPGGTTILDGNIYTANFSSDLGRTSINDSTDPSSFLSDGSAGGLQICNIGTSGSTISFDYGSSCTSGANNDDFDTPEVISGTPYSHTQDTSTATVAIDDPSFPCGYGGTNTVWFRFTPSENGMLLATTEGSGYDTMLAVWSGARGSLANIACNDDAIGTQSEVSVNLTAGVTYYIEVAGYGSASDLRGAKYGDHGDRIPASDLTNASGSLNLYVEFTSTATIPLYTTFDNENNALEGMADGDLDTYIYNSDSVAPIEFNIYVPDVSSLTSAELLLLNYDVDEEYGEVDEVYFNGYYAGTLTGANGSWSTTTLTLNPGWIVQGDNLVQIYIDVNNIGSWAVETDWGQLLLNGQGNGTAYVYSASINKSAYLPGETISLTADIDTTLASQDLRTEVNLRNPSGIILAAQTIDHTIYGSDYDPISASLVIPNPAAPGSYNVQILVYDATTNLIQDTHVIFFTVIKRLTLRSVGANDGYILESSETSGLGGTINATNTSFILGDGISDRQYRAVLSFNTAGLPDNAVITNATLKIRKMGLVGSNPFSILGRLRVDIRKPFFGTSLGLAAGDFQAAASRAGVGLFGTAPLNNWYTASIGSTGWPYVNKTGTTQFRLYFTIDDNNDNGADYMTFFSGNYSNSVYRPTLVIEYSVP